METKKQEFRSERLGDYTIELQKVTEKSFRGDVIATDPCYFVDDEIWQNLCSMWFEGHQSTPFAGNGIARITVKGKTCEFLYTSTAYGDGDYPMYRSSGELKGRPSLGVDAGMISVALLEDAKHLCCGSDATINIEKDEYYPKLYGFDGSVRVQDHDFVGDICVQTADDQDYDEDY